MGKDSQEQAQAGQDVVDLSSPAVKREDGAVIIDATALMARFEEMERRVGAAEDRAASAEAQANALREQLESAQENGFFIDEFGNRVSCLTSSMQQGNSQIHDKPGTLLEKLDIMQKQAALRKEPFDRERTRRILSGETVEDFCKYRCEHCGRAEEAWNTNEALYDEHVERHTSQAGRKAAYPGRQKIRKADRDLALVD